jgi:SAM-dependent methyltransferase
MHNDCYNREPLRYEDEIAIFSEKDDYIRNYDQISDDHLEQLKEKGENPFIPEQQWLEFELSTVAKIQKFAKKGDKILDIGVGLGRTLSHFPDLSKYGVDINLRYLKESSSKGIKASLAKIEELPYKDEYFDIIVCTDVLEHVLDINLAVRNILRTLKKGGYLIIRVPYRENLGQYLTPGYPYFFVHVRNFDEYSLQLLFTKIFSCKFIMWDTVGDVINDERNKFRIKYYGRFWKFYQWYFRWLQKNRPKSYANKFYKCEINFVSQKT